MLSPRLLCVLTLCSLFLAPTAIAQNAPASGAPAPIEAMPDWTRAIDLPDAKEVPSDTVRSGVWNLVFSKQINQLTDEVYSYKAIKIVNQSGVEEGSTVSVLYNPDFQRLAFHSLKLHREGQILDRLPTQRIELLRSESDRELLIYNNEMEALLILDDLREGDILECAYTIAGSNPVAEGEFETTISTAWSVPVAHQHFRLLWPLDKPLLIRDQGKSITLEERFFDDRVEYEWEQRDAPIVHPEDLIPSWFNPWSYTEISSYLDWQTVARWGARLYQQEDEIGPELQAAIESLRELSSDEAKITGALRWVQDNIRYTSISIGEHNYKPYPLNNVVARRFGDCKDKSRMLAAMLGELGFDAKPALVNTYSGRILDEAVPGPSNFNHVITRLRFNNKTYWLDPTYSFQRGELDSLFARDYGFALTLDQSVTSLEPTGGANNYLATTSVTERFTEAPGNQADLTVTSVYQGADADGMRYSINSSNPSAFERNYLNHYANFFPSIEVANPIRFEDDETRNRITIRESYRIKKFLTSAEDGTDDRYAEFYASTLRGVYSDPSTRLRSAPLGQTHPQNLRHSIEVQFLEDDWRFDDEDRTIENDGFHFSFSVASGSRRLNLDYSFTSRSDVIEATNTPAYVADVDRLEKALSYSIVRYGPATLAAESSSSSAPFYGHLIPAATAGVFTLPLAMILIARPRRIDLPLESAERQHELYGLGGWLVLVGIGVCLRPIFAAGYFLDPELLFTGEVWEALTHPNGEAYHPLNSLLLYVEPIFAAVHFSIAVGLLILFFRKSRFFPMAFIGTLIFEFLFAAGDLALVAVIDLLSMEDMQEQTTAALRATLAAVIWISYTLRSDRVKNTFIH